MSIAVEDTIVVDTVRDDVDPPVVVIPAEPVETSTDAATKIPTEHTELLADSKEPVEILTTSTEPVEIAIKSTEPVEISTGTESAETTSAEQVESSAEPNEISSGYVDISNKSSQSGVELSENTKNLNEQEDIAPVEAATGKQLGDGVDGTQEEKESQPLTAKQRKAQKWLEKLAVKKAEKKALAVQKALTMDEAAATTTINGGSTEQTPTPLVKESKSQKKKKNKAAVAVDPTVDALLSMNGGPVATTTEISQHSDVALTVPSTELPLPARKKKPNNSVVLAIPSTTTTETAATTATTATIASENIPQDSSTGLPTTTSFSEKSKKKKRKNKKMISEESSVEMQIVTESTQVAVHDQMAISAEEKFPPVHLVHDQIILLHSILTILQQSVYHKEAYIYTQQSTMCMYLQIELCRLGYSCIEGDPNKFQYITWFPASQSVNSTGIIYNSLYNYPINANKKGDIKINAPELFVQCCCYPSYGSASPAMMNMKSFRKKFLASIQDIAIGNSDSFVFILTEEVYEEYAVVSLPSLPVVTALSNYLSTYTLPYHDSKTSIQYELKVLLTTVDTGNARYVVAGVHA